MIPILYESDERRFVTNGIGRLSDCLAFTVTEERNGIFEAEFTYPITGARYADIQEGRIVAATHDDTGEVEPFEIYGRTAPINGIVTFYAHHISYRLSDVVVAPFTAQNITAALDGIALNSVNENPFTFWTDKTADGAFTVAKPDIARALLSGQEGSILDVYGKGEYQFNRFNVRLYTNRGTDSGVEIRFGKNLIDLTHDTDTSGTYNAVVPYWSDSDGNVFMLPEQMVVYAGATVRTTTLTDDLLQIIRTDTDEPIEVGYSVIDAIPLDLSSNFSEQPTEAELRAAATAYLTNNEGWVMDENIAVDFVALWQTEEYANVAPLQRVSLCDTVNVSYPALGINKIKEKVVKTVYNVLLDRYDSIELGQAQTTLAQSIAKSTEREILEIVPTFDQVDEQIELIRGGLGGYIRINRNANGKPEEILIMDQPDVADAVNIIRMNKNGIAFSQRGYDGPFNSAWTIDGVFMAQWIKAGLLSDRAGKNYWNMETGDLVARTIRAIDYIYMDGDENSYFKVPFLGGKTHYFELSTLGLLIQGEYSTIRNYLTTFQPSTQPNRPSVLSYFEGLRYRADVEDDDHTYISEMSPIDVSLQQLPLGGGDASYDAFITPGSIQINNYSDSKAIQLATLPTAGAHFDGVNVQVTGTFKVTGTKSRIVDTDNYGDRLLYCYETPTPIFGDIGEAVIDADGFCYIDLDDIFGETTAYRVEYHVFLQKEGAGDCWVADKQQRFFVVEGTPGLKFAWEIKAKQRDYEFIRLEEAEDIFAGDDYISGDGSEFIENYAYEQEGELIT